MIEPKVSIIIPVFNSSKYLNDSFESALNQSYKNIEIVAVDDCSEDNSWEILNEYASKHNNVFIAKNEKRRKAGYTRNKAIEISSGDFILPLDSDNILHHSAVEKLLRRLLNTNGDIAYCNYKFFKKDINETPGRIMKTPHKIEINSLLRSNQILVESMFKRNIWQDYAKFCEEDEIIMHEDWCFWLGCALKGAKFVKVDEILVFYRIRDDSTTAISKKRNSKLFEIDKKIIFNKYGIKTNI